MGKPRRSLAVALLVAALPAGAAAQDTAAGEDEFRLWGEPISFTDVPDAFDRGDPFDVYLSLGYDREFVAGTIQREVTTGMAGSGRSADRLREIARHERTRNILAIGAEIGIFHDIAIYARLPIVLSDTRELKATDDGDLSVLNEQQPGGTSSIPLFSVPFKSPDRSGIDHLELGLSWGLFNQYRDGDFPSWTIRLGGRLSLGDAMKPCESEEGRVPGEADYSPTSRCNGGDAPGITDGAHYLTAETRASYRLRYVEPFLGLLFEVGFPGNASEQFQPGGDLSGFTNTIPPIRGTFTAGLAVVPWEQRVRAQRIVVDLRFVGGYVSEGHYYSPLFDALGTSDSAYLRSLNYEGVDMAGNPTGRSVAFTGLTDMSPHGSLMGRFAIEMQAAEYVKFRVGLGIGGNTPYILTYADACNPNRSAETGDPRIGSCRSGIINPHHRSNIDLPGRRFRVDGETLFDFYASVMAQF